MACLGLPAPHAAPLLHQSVLQTKHAFLYTAVLYTPFLYTPFFHTPYPFCTHPFCTHPFCIHHFSYTLPFLYTPFLYTPFFLHPTLSVHTLSVTPFVIDFTSVMPCLIAVACAIANRRSNYCRGSAQLRCVKPCSVVPGDWNTANLTCKNVESALSYSVSCLAVE